MSDSFNERLRLARELAGLSQVELSQKVGISKTLYNKYEKTTTRPSFDTLISIARELNVTIDYLLARTTIEKAPSPEGEDAFDPLQGVPNAEIIRELIANAKQLKPDNLQALVLLAQRLADGQQ